MPLRSKELLLSGPAKGLPDQSVRATHRRPRQGQHVCRRRGRSPHDQHHQGAPGGGRGEVDSRCVPGPDRRRSESRRHALARSGVRPRPAHARRGGRLLPRDACPRAHLENLRRQPERGVHALRRQRLRSPRRHGRTRRTHGNKEPQLLPLRRTRPAPRDRAAGRRPGVGRPRETRNAAVRRGT